MDLRAACAVLSALSGPAYATEALLRAHGERARLARADALRLLLSPQAALAASMLSPAPLPFLPSPSSSSSSCSFASLPPDPQGVDLAATLAQTAAIAVCSAAADVDGAILNKNGFPSSSTLSGAATPPRSPTAAPAASPPSAASFSPSPLLEAVVNPLLVAWADSLAGETARDVRRFAIGPSAAPAGIAAVAAAVAAAAAEAAEAGAATGEGGQPSGVGIDLSARIIRDLWPCLAEVLEHSLGKKAAAARRGAARDVEKILLTTASTAPAVPPPRPPSPPFPSASSLAEADVPGICSALSPLRAANAVGTVEAAAVEAAARLFASWCDGAEEAVLSSSASSGTSEAAAAASVLSAAELLAATSLPQALLSRQSKPSASGAPPPCFAERLGKLKEALRSLLTAEKKSHSL